MERLYYIAIRHSSDGHDWLDIETISPLLSLTQAQAEKTDKQIPGWRAANPVTRYTQVHIKEITPNPK